MTKQQKAVETLKRFWTGAYWQGVSVFDREEIDAAFATLAAAPAQAKPKCRYCQDSGEVMMGDCSINPCDMCLPAQAEPSVPEGWKLVPVQPTQEMCQVAQWKLREWPRYPFRVAPVYQAMIDAAPKR